MKRNSDFAHNAEALMLLAEFLHNALLWRGREHSDATTHKKAKSSRGFEEAMERLRKSVDYRAKGAENILRCKITSMALPRGREAVCINISASPKKVKKV